MTAVAVRGSEISLLKSVVEEMFCQNCHHFWAKCGQSRMTCLAVSHCHPQEQASESTPGTWCWNRKAARLILPVRICVSRLLWGLGRLVWSWKVAALYGILSGFQPPPRSRLVSWRGGGGPPSSSFQWSQHHYSASW